MYLVTIESDNDGMWWDEPAGFDSKLEADNWAAKQTPPAGHSVVIYSCSQVGVVPSRAAQVIP